MDFPENVALQARTHQDYEYGFLKQLCEVNTVNNFFNCRSWTRMNHHCLWAKWHTWLICPQVGETKASDQGSINCHNSNKESQPCHQAGNLYQGKNKPVPGEAQTDNETMLWALPDYIGRSKESWFSPLGSELFQLFICFDSKVMHEVMCKMCVT